MLNITKRKRGGHSPPGEIKYKILLYLLDNTDGIDEPTLRYYFKINFNISEPKNMKKHLEDLRKKRCIKKSEKSGFANHWAINDKQHIANIIELYPNIVPNIQKNSKIISLLVEKDKFNSYTGIIGDLLPLSASFFRNYLSNDLFLERFKTAWINLNVESSTVIQPSDIEAIISSSVSFILFEMFKHCVIEDNINGVIIEDAFEFIKKNQDRYSLDRVMGWHKGHNDKTDYTKSEFEKMDI